ncbi:MAG: MOSC domain-containing protein [Gaiellales bacterium]
MEGSVAWITIAPVKALALVHRDEVEVEPFGVRDNRRFYLVDDNGRMINGKVVGPLVSVVPDYDEGTGCLALHLPDGDVVTGAVDDGEPMTTSFFGRPVAGRIVEGPWSEALSGLAGRSLRLVRTEEPGHGTDRGGRAGVSLVGTASLEALATAAGVERVDGRRFRMLFGVDGVPAHAEDKWIGRRVRIGDAVIRPRGNVGRCAVTTQDPETGVPDLDTLRVLGQYRGDVETSEPLPFGVWGEILEPGRVRLGDPVVPE